MAKRCDIDREQVDSACTQFASQCKRACRELLAGLRLNEPVPGTTSVTVEPGDIIERTYRSSNSYPREKNRPSFSKLDSENEFNYLNYKGESGKKVVRFTKTDEETFLPAKKPPANALLRSKIARSGTLVIPERDESEDITGKAERIVDETIMKAVEAFQKRVAPNAINQPQTLQCSTHCEQPCKTRNAKKENRLVGTYQRIDHQKQINSKITQYKLQ